MALPQASPETLHSLLYEIDQDDPPVFIAVDFEQIQVLLANFRPTHRGTQAGLSILDTKDPDFDPEDPRISSFLFVTGEDKVYFASAARRFRRFGTAEQIKNAELGSKIENWLDVYKDRKIVLVGHGMSGDLAILQMLGSTKSSNIIAKVDTQLLACNLILDRRSGLLRLLKAVKCPVKARLHNAGNDAYLTMRAMLLLGKLVKSRREHEL